MEDKTRLIKEGRMKSFRERMLDENFNKWLLVFFCVVEVLW